MKQNYQEVKILLVEDDDIDAKSVEREFRKLKLINPIYRAKHGIEALEVLHGENDKLPIKRPYIILLDLNNADHRTDWNFRHAIRNDNELKTQ